MGGLLDELHKEAQQQGLKKTQQSVKGGLKIDNYIDNVEEFYLQRPFFYDNTQMFWLWNNLEYKYEICDDITLMNLIDDELGFFGQTVSKGIKGNYMEAFKRVGRKHEPAKANKNWIQFKNKIIDVTNKEEQIANPKYFITNPIPWELSNETKTPIMDEMFKQWLGDNTKILYEVLAYCLLTDYPIHIIIANIGSGRNGKSQYCKIIEKFVGINNTTSAELDCLIKERFESVKLHKKLVCLMGETNFGTINSTSLLKKLCGGDLISYEYKGKTPFVDNNYAKIIINTNTLPATGDTTDGFFRRWLIINWSNCFKESGKDIYLKIPNQEFFNLTRKCFNILCELLDKGSFTDQGSIEQRKKNYIEASNPITLFLNERCDLNDSYYVKAKDLYHSYITYLQERKRRIIKRKEFNQILAEEGYQAEHCSKKDVNGDFESSYWVIGLKLKIILILPIIRDTNLQSHEGEKGVGNIAQLEELEENKKSLSLNFLEVQNILLDRFAHEIETDTLISYGVCEKNIQKWKNDGLIYENRAGFIKLL